MEARQAAWQPGPKLWSGAVALPYWAKAFTSNSSVPKSAGVDRGGYEACARKSTRTEKNRTAVAEFGTAVLTTTSLGQTGVPTPNRGASHDANSGLNQFGKCHNISHALF